MVLQLLGELLEVGLAQWDHLPAAGLLQHGPVPVVGTHSPQQDPILGGGTAAVGTEPEQRHRKSRAKALQVALGMGLGPLFVLFFPYQKQFLPSPPVGVKLMHAEDEMGEEPVGWVLWGNAHGGP